MGRETKPSRRRFLEGFSAVTTGSIVFGSAAAAGPTGRGSADGFPPSGITSWGDSATLGDGDVSTFSSVTPSGTPKYVGVHFSERAHSGLPSPAELMDLGAGTRKDGGIVGRLHGGFWSLLYDLSFPSDTPEPIEYLGLGWNSQGHLPHGVYSKPHFDIHFYFHEPEAIRSIGPRNPAPTTPPPLTSDDIAAGQIPENYRLIEGGAVVPKMGAHLAPADAPEFEDRSDASGWLKTLIWGAADVVEETPFELNFVEPMVTLDYFENHLDGVHEEEIAQPEVYPMDGWYPTAYSVRDLGGGGYAVVMQDFEHR
ncbi:hypothetical protein [Haloarchaeobius sp. HRN-SO-5]|uniref:hypothetical protein n=1 Tax=Haloarchaeobius sp. HRN-SO-5 TaxID=3446118 RepID=UPI003EBB910E